MTADMFTMFINNISLDNLNEIEVDMFKWSLLTWLTFIDADKAINILEKRHSWT
jgi:hypothetical protein